MDTEELRQHIIGDTPAPKKESGNWNDIKKIWERIYKEEGWNNYATFNKRGNLNTPYVLFKAKNVLDTETRKHKWMKARPIAPGTNHPMKRLFGLVGRAWYFATSQIPGEHFVLNKCSDVPIFLKEAHAHVKQHAKRSLEILKDATPTCRSKQ